MTNWEAGLDTHTHTAPGGGTWKTPHPAVGTLGGEEALGRLTRRKWRLWRQCLQKILLKRQRLRESKKAAELETGVGVGMQRWGRVWVLRWEELGDIYRLGGGTQETEAKTQKERAAL